MAENPGTGTVRLFVAGWLPAAFCPTRLVLAGIPKVWGWFGGLRRSGLRGPPNLAWPGWLSGFRSFFGVFVLVGERPNAPPGGGGGGRARLGAGDDMRFFRPELRG